MGPAVRQMFIKDAEDCIKELCDKFHTASLRPHLLLVEKHMERNGSGYLVGKEVRITLAFRQVKIDLTGADCLLICS